MCWTRSERLAICGGIRVWRLTAADVAKSTLGPSTVTSLTLRCSVVVKCAYQGTHAGKDACTSGHMVMSSESM